MSSAKFGTKDIPMSSKRYLINRSEHFHIDVPEDDDLYCQPNRTFGQYSADVTGIFVGVVVLIGFMIGRWLEGGWMIGGIFLWVAFSVFAARALQRDAFAQLDSFTYSPQDVEGLAIRVDKGIRDKTKKVYIGELENSMS